MQVQENFPLKAYNTFGIEANARWFAAFADVAQLSSLLDRYPRAARLVLGGGSNILFTGNYDGLVLKNEIGGIQLVAEDDENVYVKAGAGENWHLFVQHCIGQQWAGLENLSLIPGCTGASPMQNIGAYGVEVRDVFHELTAYHLQEKSNYTFRPGDCDFGYRESVFKKKYKGQFVITDVTFRLNKRPVFNTSYGAIEEELDKMGVTALSIRAIADAVIRIRSSKLPDPREIGNAGSFFKNPVVDRQQFLQLKEIYPSIPGYPHDNDAVKIAAGWLIEQCGWKGFRKGDAGVHARQALVLVNYGRATGREIYDLSEEIKQSVREKFNVLLEREVNII